MSNTIEPYGSGKEPSGYMFYCPGCKEHHGFAVKGKKTWTFNGDREKPTFAPSLLLRTPFPDGDRICHLFLREGVVQFLGDCTHDLAGTYYILPQEGNDHE